MTESADRPLPLRQNAHFAVICTAVAIFILVMATFANQVAVELGTLRAQALQVDETYFASCAARGTAAGEFLPAGCHDNKAPLIFLAHQAVQAITGPYDIAGIKRAAFGLTIAVAALAGWLASRLAPPQSAPIAALLTAALIVQALLVDVGLMALKTEMLGIAFVLMSLLACLPRRGPVTSAQWMLAGFFCGLAIMSKQTFALAAFVLFAWCAVSVWHAPGRARPAALAVKLGCLVAGILLPLLLLLSWFHVDGRSNEFLASTFLYPSVYGGPSSAEPAVKAAVWRLAHIFHTLSRAPILLAFFCFAVIACAARLGQGARETAGFRSTPGFLGLVVPTTLALFSVTLIAPIFFDFHLVPTFVLMAVVGGVGLSQIASSLTKASSLRKTAAICVGVLAVTVVAAASTFYTNAGRGRSFPPISDAAFLPGYRGSFAYILGMWPDVYAYNGLIPASNVQFLWALPGTPANGLYQPPAETTDRGRWMASQHRQNLVRIYDDFKQTPPEFIVVSEHLARSRTSTRISDVPGFDEYLAKHCTFLRQLPVHIGSPQALYGCGELSKQKEP